MSDDPAPLLPVVDPSGWRTAVQVLGDRWTLGDTSVALEYAWALKKEADGFLDAPAIRSLSRAVAVATQMCDGPDGSVALRRDLPMLLGQLAFRRRAVDDLGGARDAAGEAWDRWLWHMALDQDDDWLWVGSRYGDLYARTLVSAGEAHRAWEILRECLGWVTARGALTDAESDAGDALLDHIAEIEFAWSEGRRTEEGH